MCEDERIEECKGCNEEACVCDEICPHCKGWKLTCSCLENAQDMEQEIKKGMDDE